MVVTTGPSSGSWNTPRPANPTERVAGGCWPGRRLQVGRPLLVVYLGEVVREQVHPDALAAVRGVGAQQGQVEVVGSIDRQAALEQIHGREHAVGAGPCHFGDQLGQIGGLVRQ